MAKKRAAYKAYHFIYKTTCLITNKCYYGLHSTDDLEDGYLGSGKIIRLSVKKYGKENHVRVIVEMLPDRKSLCLREAEIVNRELLRDEMCMNLIPGGNAYLEETFERISKALIGRKLSPEHCSKMKVKRNKPAWNKGLKGYYKASIETRQKLSGHVAWNRGLSKTTDERVAKFSKTLSIINSGRKLSDEQRQKLKGRRPWNKGLTKTDHPSLTGNGGYWKGKTLSDERKQQISETSKGRKHTEASKAKMRQSAKTRKKPPPKSLETRKKLSEAGMGRKVSEETRQKLRDARQRTILKKRGSNV